jgi:2-oxoisovalerate dehydrogenase E1 component
LKPYLIDKNDADFAREMLARMSFIRAFEAKILALTQTNPPQLMGSTHLCAGQEAVPLGTVAGTRPDDQILATYRGHGWALAAGLDPQAVMDEICHRRTGLNGGRGGSAYFMAPGTRFIGENSIVGAGFPIACGIAMANLQAGNGRIVLTSIGDGAMNQGSVHEAMAFASVRKLPILFICENNGWSELTATSDMFLIDRLAKRGSAYGIPAATVAGTDPITVRDTIAIAAEQCRAGDGPRLIEFRVPRLWGHYNRDIEHYRSKADKQQAQAQDPITLITARLIESGHMTKEETQAVIDQQESAVARIAEAALAAPPPDPREARLHVMASARPSPASAEPAETREMTYIEAVNAALRAELENDPATVVYGEDVGKSGGIFGAARYLQRDFGAMRVFDTPIAESAILGSAVGAALAGLKPIVEIMWADFVFVALDQIVNQATNVRYITQGRQSVPLVVRMQQGATPGSCAQHSQSIEAIFAHFPGLKVALAATAQDAYALLRAAAADPDPCIVIESRGLYQTRGPVALSSAPEPVGLAHFHRNGKDAAIVTWGTMLKPALEAAALLGQEGLDVSVLDLRWLSPLDEAALSKAVAQSDGKILIVHEAVKTGGFGAEIAMRIRELHQDDSPLRIKRLAGADNRMPASPVLQSELLPNAERIATAVRELVDGRRNTQNTSSMIHAAQ